MEEYKSNSRKSQEEKSEKNIEKVISGEAKVKKKNDVQKFADVFISEDVSNVKSYIFMDVLIPAIKKAISDIVINGIDMILYGETGKTKRHTQGNKPSYRSYYEDKSSSNHTNQRRSVYSFDDVLLSTRADAEELLDSMIAIVEEYGTVSVGDMYDLVGVANNYTDHKYGWTDLRTAHPERDREGNYYLKLPKVLPL